MSSGAPRSETPRPWYSEGLRFGCRACGRCCGGAPGYVWVDDDEVADLAAFLGLPREQFRQLYVRCGRRGMSLREKRDFDCVLLDSGGQCLAYEARPLQCRVWPFWPSNLESPEAWAEAAARCPGIGQGPLIRFEQIEAQRLEMKGDHADV